MFWYYKVIHKYILNGRAEVKGIGIFSSQEKAREAIEMVKSKLGFVDYPECFLIRKRFNLFKPRLLDHTFWRDGFMTVFCGKTTDVLPDDREKDLMKNFSFLLTEYDFKFEKHEFGDKVDESGKLWFHGPFNGYYFYNDKVCINFMHLVQREDWYIYITKEVLADQNLIQRGEKVPETLWYDWPLLASVIKEKLDANN